MSKDDKAMKKRSKSIVEYLQKYKAIFVILITIPILLSVACYFSLPFFNEAGSSAWLGFWGGYLGSAIMAGVTLYVLDKQLSQNHKENLCNAVLQIATLTNNEEKGQVDKLADALVEFQSSFDYLMINQVAERMLKGQYLATDVVILNNLIRDVDSKGFRVDVLLKPFPQSEFIKEYNLKYNGLYNEYGLLIADLISFIDLMKDLPKDKIIAKAMVLNNIKNCKKIEANTISMYDIPGFKKPKRVYEIIEENKYYEDIEAHSSDIIKEIITQSANDGANIKEELKSIIIELLNYEYQCINDNFNDKMKVYE